MQWTISRRIVVGFVLGLVLVVVMGVVGSQALNRTARSYEAALEADRELLTGALQAESDMRAANVYVLRMALRGELDLDWSRDSLVTASRRRIERLRSFDATPELRALWSEALTLIDRWDQSSRAIIDATAADDDGEAQRMHEQVSRPTRDALDGVLARAIQEVEARTNEITAEAENGARRARTGLWLGTALALLVGGFAAWFLNRSVHRPLRATSHVIASSATEILAATTQQASGANESMAAVTQAAATVDQVVQTAEQAAERAQTVASSAKQASEIGRQGREAIEQSMAFMADVKEQVDTIGENILALAEQADAIGEIIATVNDLADQTNLLALNAGIEAARAGELGRGFGVVAGEVKNLADESKAATARVRQILGDVQGATSTAVMSAEQGTKRVAQGMQQVTGAGDTIRSLVDSVAEDARAAIQIAASTGQQSTGMNQIREAIDHIQQAAQQNLAATRQSETAARDLNRLGRELVELIGHDGRSAPGA